MMTRVFTVLLGLTVMAQAEEVDSAEAISANLSVKRYPMMGSIAGNNVNVRSGPGTNYYITQQLNSADSVTIEGYEIGWHMIAPPPGSFSLIHKDYLEVRNDEGIVTGDAVRVRAGSNLTPQRYAIQTKANKGDRLKVLGKIDDWYKVVPPLGAHLFVSDQFVNVTDSAVVSIMPDTALHEATETTITEISEITELLPVSESPDTIATAASEATVAEGTVAVAGEQASLLSDYTAVEAQSDNSSEQALELPNEEGLTALERYRAAEQALVQESRKPAFSREYGPLLARYQGLAGMEDSNVVGDYAQQRIRWIERQMVISDSVAAIDRLRAEQEQARLRLAQEQATMVETQAAFEADQHVAVGIIEPSFVFTEPGNQRWRLVDPETRQTLFYLEKTNPLMSFETLVGRTVGVEGETVYEPTNKVRIIRVTEISQR